MDMSFVSHENKTYIHMNGFALALGLKRRAIEIYLAIRCITTNLVTSAPFVARGSCFQSSEKITETARLQKGGRLLTKQHPKGGAY